MAIQCCFLVVSQAQCIEQLVGCSDLQFLSHYFDDYSLLCADLSCNKPHFGLFPYLHWMADLITTTNVFTLLFQPPGNHQSALKSFCHLLFSYGPNRWWSFSS